MTYVCLTKFPTPGIQFFILESQKNFYVERNMKCKILSFPKPATLVPIGHGMHTFFSLCNVTQMCLQYFKSGSSIQGLNASHLLNIIPLWNKQGLFLKLAAIIHKRKWDWIRYQSLRLTFKAEYKMDITKFFLRENKTWILR